MELRTYLNKSDVILIREHQELLGIHMDVESLMEELLHMVGESHKLRNISYNSFEISSKEIEKIQFHLSYLHHRETILYIRVVIVKEKYRGKGLLKQLLLKIEESAKKYGYSGVGFESVGGIRFSEGLNRIGYLNTGESFGLTHYKEF